jgi:hypothetical protein
MGHNPKHIGLDCPKWRLADGQSRIAECEELGLCTERLQHRGQHLSCFLVATGGNDPAAFLREGQCRRAADAHQGASK